jgi:fused signal recognition particle receptor
MVFFSRKKTQQTEEKKGWGSRLKNGLGKTSSRLTNGIKGALTKRKLDDDTLESLEDVLIMTDMGMHASDQIIDAIRQTKFDKEVSNDEVREVIAEEIASILEPVAKPLLCEAKPEVILMCGVNGSGKTTTIGKLAQRYQREGKKVVIAACDTFRAAAVEQLQVWAERVGAEFVSGEAKADAASVAYKAVERARELEADVVLIDTAGRLENKQNLMQELEKMIRVVQKLDSQAPHKRIMVLDATTGQNANQQVKVFAQKAGLTGLIVTKLDGTAKGGVVVSLAKQFELPIHAVGVGEAVEDLNQFDAQAFAKSLVAH